MRRPAVSLVVVVATVLATLATTARSARGADPTTADCLEANNSAIDLRNAHRLRDARVQLLVCSAASCPADVRKECLRRVDEVNLAIPTVIFEAKDAAGKDLSAVQVTMDGQPLASRLEGTAISIDPGEHTFTFETAGQQPPLTKQFVIRESQKDRREAIVFGAAPVDASTLPKSTALVAPRPAEAGSALGTQRVLGLVAGGVAVAALAAGGVFGLQAIAKRNDAQSVCPGECATLDGVRRWSDARSAAQLSDVLFAVGGGCLAAAGVLWWTAPSPSPRATLGVGPKGVQVRGAW